MRGPSEGEKRLGTVSGEASAGGGRGGSCGQGNVLLLLLLHDQEREPARVQEVRHVGGYRLPSGVARAAPIAAASSNQSSETAS